ncbi:DUF624 domain-containing protein [Natronorubrum sp. DTA7]|uniref:DUF624 domain-containing protein n=1 Tax=Natronorubrum sp. DTA7 TaxID=3447016 RepID=UPI003F864B3C
MTRPTDLDPMYASLKRTGRFVWANLVSIVWISIGWFLASLPIVTLGPATVGAYRAVLSLREDGHHGIDRAAVLETVRRQFVHATLLGLVPLVLLAIAANYALAYLVSGTIVAGLLALCCAYAGLYAWLVSIPTLLGLAEGKSVGSALGDGLLWTARHAVGAVALGVVTSALLVVTSLLTVAVALLFAGVAFALHVEFISSVAEREAQVTTVVTER